MYALRHKETKEFVTFHTAAFVGDNDIIHSFIHLAFHVSCDIYATSSQKIANDVCNSAGDWIVGFVNEYVGQLEVVELCVKEIECKLKRLKELSSKEIQEIKDILDEEDEYHNLTDYAQKELLEQCIFEIEHINDPRPVGEIVSDELYVYMKETYEDARS